MKSTLGILLLVVGVAAGTFFATKKYLQPKERPAASSQLNTPTPEDDPEDEKGESLKPASVSTVHPKLGALEIVSVQPGSIQAFEFVQLFSKVSGYLKSQKVDIGDKVTKGQVLAEIDIPELDKMVQKNKAIWEQAITKVDQMQSRIASTKADLKVSLAGIVQAEATAKSDEAGLRFREKQLTRMKELFALKSIDERLVDENQERYEAAAEKARSTKALIETSHAQVAAAEAKIQQALADKAAAEAEVRVALAELERSTIQQSFAKIQAPFDGVITHRNSFPGDYVRAANEGSPPPLLTVQRTDRMRVVVLIPDREVPFTDPGDSAIVQIDAMPDQKILAKISRISQTEDPQTRLMLVEIDVPNPTGKIRQGMYGKVTIVLDKIADQLSIPSNCLNGRTQYGKGTVLVEREGKARAVPVRLGVDNGIRVAILEGLQKSDKVILNPPANLTEGSEVLATLVDVPLETVAK